MSEIDNGILSPAKPIKEIGDDKQADVKKSNDHLHDDVSATDGNEGKEHTRSRMALLFVLGFFAILFLVFVYAMMVGAKLSDLKDTLIGVIGALSGILGFIVGYYYKSTSEQEQ